MSVRFTEPALAPAPASSSHPPTPPDPSEPGPVAPPEAHSPGSPDSPHTYHLPNMHAPAVDPERQALLGRSGSRPTSMLTRIPLLLLLALVLSAAVFVGVGGWRLGAGEGKGRWPGGPH